MLSKSDFWLTLNKLAHDLELEGANDEDQVASLSKVLNSLSHATKRVYCDNLEAVLKALTALAVSCRRDGH